MGIHVTSLLYLVLKDCLLLLVSIGGARKGLGRGRTASRRSMGTEDVSANNSARSFTRLTITSANQAFFADCGTGWMLPVLRGHWTYIP